MKIAINIVTWNSAKYIADCLHSIARQTATSFFVQVIDNNSKDGTVAIIKKDFPLAKVLVNEKNNGFSGAHNQGIELAREAGAEFVLVTNPDIILAPNFLEELMKEVEKHPEAGSFGGKLLRVDSPQSPLIKGKNGFPPAPFNKGGVIDSVGLKIYRNRGAVDLGGGEEDQGQFEEIKEVFGISGALALYRLEALKDIKLDSHDSQIFANKFASFEYFDNDFFAYKEDVDLAWRLQLAGWKSLYLPRAVAWHRREARSSEGWKKIFKSRRQKSGVINYYSYKNHWLMLVKNEYFRNFWRDLPWIASYEVRKLAYILFFEPQTLFAIIKFFIQLPKMLKKRKIIMGRGKIGAGEMRKWFRK